MTGLPSLDDKYKEFWYVIWFQEPELNTCELTKFEIGKPLKIKILGKKNEKLIEDVTKVEVELDDEHISEVQPPLA